MLYPLSYEGGTSARSSASKTTLSLRPARSVSLLRNSATLGQTKAIFVFSSSRFGRKLSR